MNKTDNKYIIAILTTLSLVLIYLINYFTMHTIRVISLGRFVFLTSSYLIALSSAYFGASILWVFSKRDKGFRPFKIAVFSSIIFSIGKLIIFSSMMVTIFIPIGTLGIYSPFIVSGLILLVFSFLTYLTAKKNCSKPVEKQKKYFQRGRNLIVLVVIWTIIILFFTLNNSPYPIGRKPKTINTVNIDIKDTTLNLFSDEKNRELLLRHFASSIDWKVGLFNGNFRVERAPLCAVKKNKKGLSYETTLNGQITSFDLDSVSFEMNSDIVHVNFRFEDVPNKWNTKEAIVGSKEFELDVDSARHSRNLNSAMIIKGNGIDIFIRESSKDKERKFTQKTIYELNDLLKKLLNSETAKDRGFDPELMPRGAVIKSNKSEIVMDGSSGYYNFKGYVNPGEKGYVYLRAYNPNDKTKDLINDYFKKSSIEYTGWSDDPNEKFSFDILDCIQSSTLKQKAVIEVWFHSLERDRRDSLLISTEKTVVAFRH
ncbi:MAG: hypothetical protein PF574_04645 [Candidatus Delongbacteria bacterium]|jgi:hypothetical protein|nr:hypothetical protein [Candidatus Delongbacteria bacterium]